MFLIQTLYVTTLLATVKGQVNPIDRVVECATPSGDYGSCILLESCQPLVRLMQTGDPASFDVLRKSQCGFIGDKPKVCCANNSRPIHFRDEKTTEAGKITAEPTRSEPSDPQTSTDVPHHISFDLKRTTTRRTRDKIVRLPENNIFQSGNPPINQFVSSTPFNPAQQSTPSPETTGGSPQNFKNDELPDTEVCGLATLSNRIYGGNRTSVEEFPWMALLKHNMKSGEFYSYGCGGVLINHRYVLTAAHCATNTLADLVQVRLGEWNLDTKVDCDDQSLCNAPPLDINIEQVNVHPGFDKRNLNNDIALVRLAKDVQYSDWVRPICLPEESSRDFTQESFWVAGWGQTEYGKTSPVKLKVELQYVAEEVCRVAYRRFNLSLGESILCAGGRHGQDTCMGDSGGSLMKQLPNGKTNNFHTVGVVSLGPSRCGIEGWPGVYTKVDHYVKWIKSNLIK